MPIGSNGVEIGTRIAPVTMMITGSQRADECAVTATAPAAISAGPNTAA